MVITSTTPKIDPSKVPYLKGKSSDQISTAAAVQQPSHAEMVKVVTGFIDSLINLGVKKLETATTNNSEAEAQTTAQRNLEDYNRNQGSVTSFKDKIAGDLAKNIYAVKQFLIEGGLAEQKDNQELTFKANSTGAGGNIAAESAQELASQALESIQNKLSAYGISIDTKKVTELQKEIIKELKSPPKSKSEKETQTSNETAVNPKELLTQFTQFITEISNLSSVKTLLGQNNGLETLSKLNQDLADLNPIIKDENALQVALAQALQALDENAHSKNQAFINKYLAEPEKFKKEFNKLDDNHKLQIQMTLTNIEEKEKQTKTINSIASSIAEIKPGLGGDRLGNLLNELNSVNESHTSSSQANHLDTINTLLNDFNKNLKTANQAGTKEEKIEEKNKVTEAFIEKLNTGLNNGSLSNADIELIRGHLDPKKSESKEQNQKSITEQIFKNSIKNLNISEEQLKGFGGFAIAAIVGLMVFCPNAIGKLVQSGTGLATMAAQTLPMFFQAQAMMQMSKRGNTEGAQPSNAEHT